MGYPHGCFALSLPLLGGGDVAGGGGTKRRGGIRAPAKPGVKLGAMHVKTQSFDLQPTEPRFKDWTYHEQMGIVSFMPRYILLIYTKKRAHRQLLFCWMLASTKHQLNRKQRKKPLKMREGGRMQIRYAQKFK